MKKWTVYYRIKGVGRAKSHGCNSDNDAVNFIASLNETGDAYTGLKMDGKNASPKITLVMKGKANALLKNKNSN